MLRSLFAYHLPFRFYSFENVHFTSSFLSILLPVGSTGSLAASAGGTKSNLMIETTESSSFHAQLIDVSPCEIWIKLSLEKSSVIKSWEIRQVGSFLSASKFFDATVKPAEPECNRQV